MGVAGLWPELKAFGNRDDAGIDKPALEVFDEAWLEFQEGNGLDRSKLLGLRVGVDASAWFYHSEITEGGANPHLRTLFHRVVRLAECGVLALFVFDGPHRPKEKRGHAVPRGAHSFQTDFTQIVEAFGYEWRLAPGEAEAELAMLNKRGDIDIVITDDVDCLLFGAEKVMKHALLRKPTGTMFPCTYEQANIHHEGDLTVNGLILVALMSGGDYDVTGLTGVGPVYSTALARLGYGDELAQAIKTLGSKDLQAWLHGFRSRIKHELATNESGKLARKAGAVASKITDAWPEIKTAERYYTPVTSALPKYASFEKRHTWDQQINIGEVVHFMDLLFEYTHKEILQKLRTLVWPAIVVNALIRSLHDTLPDRQDNDPNVTPLKRLAAALSTFDLTSPGDRAKGFTRTKEQEPDFPPHVHKIFDRVEKARKERITTVTTELQLIIQPRSLAEIAKRYLPDKDHNVGKLEVRKAAERARKIVQGHDIPDSPAKPRNYVYEEPDQECKLWIQESLLRLAFPRLVREWEEREKEKANRKAAKGKKKAATTKSSSPQSKRKDNKEATSKPAARRSPSSNSDYDSDPADVFSSSPSKGKSGIAMLTVAPTSSAKGSAPLLSGSETLSSVTEPAKTAPAPARARQVSARRSGSLSSSDSDIEIVISKSPKKSPRRDLEQATARGSLPLSRPKPPSFVIPSSPVAVSYTKPTKELRKPMPYTDLSDGDTSDSLPDLPTSRPPDKAKSVPMRPSTSATSSSSSSSVEAGHIRLPNNGASTKKSGTIVKPKPISKPKVVRKTRDAEVIDLCSSD